MNKLRTILIAILILPILVTPQVHTSPVLAENLTCPPDCPYKYYFPLVEKPSGVFQGGLIIDHRHIDISQIPDYWLEQARQLTFHYGFTSHGSQIMDGLQYLETYLSSTKYAFAVSSGGTPPNLPSGTNSLKIYIGNNYSGNTYITPDMYWDGTTGINHTLSTANSELFDYSMWSWCGQADTSDASYINNYLVQMSAFETAFPDMRFILMTGHNVSNPGTNLLARNQQMRDYVIAHNLILFDFADIETYTPDGAFYNPATYNYSDGSCPWCATWCASHASYCDAQTLTISCAHTHPLFCKMKAQAFW